VVEQELGTYIDESLLGPGTTVDGLRHLVADQARASGGTGLRFYQWPLTAWCVALRQAIHHALVFPLLASMYRPSVSGLEHLEDLEGPVIFAINHNAVQWDSLVLLRALPGRWRRRMAYAAAAEITFSKRWLGIVASLVGGAFPFDRETAIRQSLEYLGGLLDGGWNVGIFPEGEQRIGQELLQFKGGVGLLGVECRAPIVPIRLVSLGPVSRAWPGFRRREAVSVRIGRPLRFSPDTPYAEAAAKIEEAVRSL
jgi:1-acyl-sn-glycerol-3-phosphate acyltransferase